MQPFELKWVLDLVGDWFDRLERRLDRRDEEINRAIESFLHALSETQIYTGRVLNHSAPRERGSEEELSRLWTKAAQSVRKRNPDLAHQCLIKAEYWAKEDEWRQYADETRLAAVTLEKMVRRAEDLLGLPSGERKNLLPRAK